jgi:hypothetical protein
LGEQWKQNFTHVAHVKGSGVVLIDKIVNEVVSISDLAEVMQFEIDLPFKSYRPFYHYDIIAPADPLFSLSPEETINN